MCLFLTSFDEFEKSENQSQKETAKVTLKLLKFYSICCSTLFMYENSIMNNITI
jgi:hypothetical protein